MQPAPLPRNDAHQPPDTDRIIGGSKLLGEMRDTIRRRHYSPRTEAAYLSWAKRFILFHHKRHPKSMGETEITAFLNYPAVDRNVSASTQNQALNGLLFLYREILGREELKLDQLTRAKRPKHLPSVFNRNEIERLFQQMETGSYKLIAALLYGGGLRLLEGLRLRIQDIEFERQQILVRNGKGAKDRVTLLPPALIRPIREQMSKARELHAKDLGEGFGEVYLPHTLARKYPHAAKEWKWQYLFPANNRAID